MENLFRISLGLVLLNFVFGVSNHGVDPSLEVDLTKALSLNIDDIQGVEQVPGFHNNAPAFLFSGENRNVFLDESYMMRVVNMLSTTSEFTLMATFLQDKKNSGSLFGISKEHNRSNLTLSGLLKLMNTSSTEDIYIDLFVSTRNDEIKFYYTHDGEIRSEKFDVDLTPNEWHQVAVTVSGQGVTLHVNCEEIVTVRIPPPDLSFTKSGLALWLGQRGPLKNLYKGYLQDAKIIAGSHSYVAQCPSATRECPTCGEYLGMVELVDTLTQKVKTMEYQLQMALSRLDLVETCECMKDCEYNGRIYEAGAQWTEGCTTCVCQGGEVIRTPAACEPVYCKNPVYEEGQCCPSCLRNCTVSGGAIIHHGEFYYQKLRNTHCSKYECDDGTKRLITQKLVSDICTEPNCPSSQRFNIPGSCCQFCEGHDFCSSEDLCTPPKICLSHSTYHECVCPGGFYSIGDTCADIDECAPDSGVAMHCQEGTQCVNLLGTYRCDCLPGYSRTSDTQCNMINECTQGGHNCSEHASCVDIVDGFQCVCNEGFIGDGELCIPDCNPPCQNGGHCELTGECVCPRGFKGKQCQNDVDECERGIHNCVGNSHCVNLVGSFHCECDIGYRRTASVTDNGASCDDINECEEANTCHADRRCNNLPGTYDCLCSPSQSCDRNCYITKKKSKKHGAEWNDGCNECTCQLGVISCSPKACDCSSDRVDLECCPECASSQSCMHQSTGVIYQDKESWIYDCQVCRCAGGFVECSLMECPTLNCRDTYTPIGDCCPQCQVHPTCEPRTTSTKSSTAKCNYNGVLYKHNQRWLMDEDFCTECTCQSGSICCHYNSLCASQL